MQKRFDILFRIVKEQRHAEILQGSPRMNSEIIMEQDYLEKKKVLHYKAFSTTHVANFSHQTNP